MMTENVQLSMIEEWDKNSMEKD